MAGFATTAAAAAGLAYALRKPTPKRPLGQGESAGPAQPDSDPEWSFENRSKFLKASDDAVMAAVGRTGVDDARSCDVLVVGGCAAGLSIAACLKKLGVDSVVVVEKNRRPGDMWRSRYHRLHLHDIIDECHLPHQKMPDSYPVFPSRQQVAAYLDDYREKQGVECLTQHTMVSASEADGGFSCLVVNATDPAAPRRVSFQAKHVVVANGVYNNPKVPAWPGRDEFKGKVVHSSRYTSAADLGLVGKKVLVVGFGNSGGEILVDLVEHGAKPTVVVRGHAPIVPRKAVQNCQEFLYEYWHVLSFPFVWVAALPMVVAADLYLKLFARLRWGSALEKHGFKVLWKGPIANMAMTLDPPLMDIGTVQLVRDGKIEVVRQPVERYTAKGMVLGGVEHEFDAVVCATGYEVVEGHRQWLDKDVADRIPHPGKSAGLVAMAGRESAVKGLWFHFGRLQGIRDAAPGLARAVAVRLGKPVPSRAGMVLKILLKHVVVYFLLRKLMQVLW
eukprot:TRINITY_DN9418_c0_g1_i1.p1 TRINITY_DN9418_c0_g1~~TRINITY_DN9418_c0_g1_i1.p1  ORF type:complete len:503 (+),score=132.73 TRINITY_DN9418_c0_g1_i1:90-1598(+)